MRPLTGSDRGREWFEAIFTEHFDRVLSYALLRADRETAREVASQTFLVAWRRRDSVPEQVLPWLLVVARNVLAEHRRAQGRRRGLLDRAIRSRAFRPAEPDPAEALADRDIVLSAFLALSDADRETLRLVAWDGLTNEEASLVVGCSASTFAVRLARARRRLDAHLSAHDANTACSNSTPLEAR